MEKEYKENLIEALDNVSRLKGVRCVGSFDEEEHALAIFAKYLDNHMAVTMLTKLIKDGKVEVLFTGDPDDHDVRYFLKLLRSE